MNLLGETVSHKRFGNGIITELCENKVTVCFAKNQKLFLFPDAFSQHLTLNNTSIQKQIEKINEEQERKINEIKEKTEEENNYRTRLSIMKIPTKSQLAYNISMDKVDDLKYIKTGCFLSGKMKGKSKIPSHIQPNSAVLLTNCINNNEDERYIIGVAMVDERFWGVECKDGLIKLHQKYKIILSNNNRLLFWRYFDRDAFPSKWGKVPFKYFENQIMEKILLDICNEVSESKQKETATNIYHYFCSINRISENRLLVESRE